MVEPLSHSLAALELTLQQLGAVAASRFRPGLDESSVEHLLAGVALTPTTEVATWFAWHDGTDIEGAPRNGTWFVPGGVFFDLARLCLEYQNTRRDFGEVVSTLANGTLSVSDLWDPAWFPLLRLEAGYVAVDLGGINRATSPVHVVWFDDEPEHRARVLWPTVDAFVVEILRRFQVGTYQVDQDGVVEGPDVDAGM
jgi:cell wall assembly regulator SMI1